MESPQSEISLGHLFLSAPFMEEVARVTRADREFQRVAEGFDDTILFQARPEPSMGIEEILLAGIEIPQARDVWAGEWRESSYVLTAPYGVFVDVLTMELDAVWAITKGAIHVKGGLWKMLRYSLAIKYWVQLLQQVPTTFEGEYRGRSKV